MKVIHTIGSVASEIGGPARSSQGIVAGLGAIGVLAWLLSFKPNERPWFKGVVRFRSVHCLGYREQVRLLEEVMDDFHPDLIHSNGIWAKYVHATIRVAHKRRIPVIVAPRGCFSLWSMRHKWLKKKIAWWFYQRWDLKKISAFHATSEAEAEDIRRLGFDQPIFIVPNAVDLPNQKPIRGSNQKLKCILFLGRIHFQKGLRELIRAWALAPHAGWVLQIAGIDTEGHQKELEKNARELGLKILIKMDSAATVFNEKNVLQSDEIPDIIFCGAVDDGRKWEVYSHADVFILPSYSENFGISVVEALYAGIPVITTHGTPWKELEIKRCGEWVALSVENLLQALIRMMSMTDQKRYEMGLRGSALVKEKYTWLAVAEQMKSVYQEVIDNNFSMIKKS